MFLYLLLTIIFVLCLKSLLNSASTKKKNKEIFFELPEEIQFEIFSRIPAKSVGRFRCLSKTWHAILSSTRFINLHRSRKLHQQSLFLLTTFKSLQVMKHPFENPTISKELYLDYSWTRVVGSCNGIVLLLNSVKDMFLINPITNELFEVPSLVPDMEKLGIELLGFGYDSSSDDYKILVAYQLYDTDLNTYGTFVDLYSVKSGVWKSIRHSLYWFAFCGSFCGAFTNGSIHWFVNRHNKSGMSFGILAFNLATEVFSDIDIPLGFHGPLATCSVFVRNECLCIVNPLWTIGGGIPGPNGKIEVWMMEEYGTVTSWTRLSTIDSEGNWYMHVPLCFSRNEEIALVTKQKTIIVCNLLNGTVTDVVVDDAICDDGCSFTGSIVSLKGISSSS